MSIIAAYAVPHPPLIIPAVGRGEERGIQATVDSYDEVARRIAAHKPELVIVSSPHAPAYRDWFHISPGNRATGDMLQYRATGTELITEYDEVFVAALDVLCAEQGFPAGTDGQRDPKLDHATYIPLWFIDKYYSGYKTVRIGLSGFGPLEHYRLGKLVAQTVEKLGRRAVYVASGDLSHKLKADGPYGFAQEGPQFDSQITTAFAAGDFLTLLKFDEAFTDKAAECGLRSFQIMAGALDGQSVNAELLSYEEPFGVGYGVAAFEVAGVDGKRCFDAIFHEEAKADISRRLEREDSYIRLARATIEAYVREGRRLHPRESGLDLPREMLEGRAGVFVSLHEHGRLRGCIGTTSPRESSIADEICHNAVSSCSEDPRFAPVRADELEELEISVDVLMRPEPIGSAGELDPKRYGVIVARDYRQGLLLPNLDGVDTVEEQINIAKRKAGISPGEEVSLQRFEVVRHEAG